MNFAPFLELPLIIQAHASSALLAVFLGPFAILRRRRDRLHKISGYVWVVAMLSVAVTSLFIPSFGVAVIGHFGPIHLFAVLTLVSLWQGMRAIFRGDITGHRAWLSGLYWQGLLVAGLVNFLPGRAVNRMLFSDMPDAGFVVIGVGGGLMIWFRVIRPRLSGMAVT
jgi:uncharacterized membrane protein